MLLVSSCWVPCDGLASHPVGSSNTSTCSCFMLQKPVKLWQCGPCAVKPLLSSHLLSGHPLFSGQLSDPRNSLPILKVNLTSFTRSPLSSMCGHGLVFPNWLILLYFTSRKRSPSWIIMQYFDAMRSKSCPVSLTAHQTQHKTCNQCKNTFAWANRSV